MNQTFCQICLIGLLFWNTIFAQEVPIISSGVDDFGRISLTVNSTEDHYYVLSAKHKLTDTIYHPVSLTIGENGTTTLTENLAAYPIEHYRVLQYLKANPTDTDKDGKDDMHELVSDPQSGALNPAKRISSNNGVVRINSESLFRTLSYKGLEVLIDGHLEDLEFVKFYILDADTDNPQVYFMNTVNHRSHGSFARAVGITFRAGGVSSQMRGEIVYHPNLPAPNGRLGIYRFEFEPNDAYSFERVQLGYELLAKNMDFLKNNFAYYPMPAAALPRYEREKEIYDSSRIHILLEKNVLGDIGYIPLNVAKGYGLLRLMQRDERPNGRDVVIYESLPNELPRVGGIITTIPQTPLSHVNLRAIQDQLPNAYIWNASSLPNISALIGKYVYYEVRADYYEMREASLQEVEAHYDSIRPTEAQIPIRDLSVKEITPLDQITFEQSSSFGVKAANVATMRTFGFPEGTIPNGFAIPFYFYDEFMKHNGFYDKAKAMMETPGFADDFDKQEEMLADFRKTIKKGEMPSWMYDALTELQQSFPAGTSIRCRSSTNNEDLPGFSGAGLYDSKTQHPDEGHISKSIRQVYASMWNFRAFDERTFYRIDHFVAAMGVLVHPNYTDEQANGVGVSLDPVFGTPNTFYLNTQLGEDLVTNPEAASIPEEILLNQDGSFFLLSSSNQIDNEERLMTDIHLQQLSDYLLTIHERFQQLYGASFSSEFAMEIEYKITREGKLAIKQARPWAAFWEELAKTGKRVLQAGVPGLQLLGYPNPFAEEVRIEFSLDRYANVSLAIFDVQGREVARLLEKGLSAGNYLEEWDGKDQEGRQVPAGLYYCRMSAQLGKEVRTETQKILRIR